MEKVRKIIMTICLIAFFCSAMYLFNDYVISPIRTTNQLNELQELIGEGDYVLDQESLAEKYPDVVFPEGMLAKYADLYVRNPDIAGWINIDALDISLPVVRAENNEKYLDTDFDGKKVKYGSIFMNCENSVEVLNYNTTLFGHYLHDSKMFGNLNEYKTVEGYKKAPIIEFNTIYRDYKWKVFAVYITNGTSTGDDGYLFNYMFTDLSSAEISKRFLSEVGARTIYFPNVDVSPSDRILTLSTCTYEFDEARLVVMARMMRPGEDEKVNTSFIKVNDNPRYPAAYYKEKGLSNPFASAYRWMPG